MTKVFLAIVGTLLLCAGMYFSGYHAGEQSAQNRALKAQHEAVTQAIEQERKKQDELTALNKSLSTDNANLNRLLRSKSKLPADYTSCVKERDRLRYVAKQLRLCLGKCREGLGYCEVQLR